MGFGGDVHSAYAFFRADLLTDHASTAALVETIRKLGYVPVEEVKYFQWKRPLDGGGVIQEVKLSAFADRKADENKDLGRHHALDAYTIAGMMTERESTERGRSLPGAGLIGTSGGSARSSRRNSKIQRLSGCSGSGSIVFSVTISGWTNLLRRWLTSSFCDVS